MIRKLFSALVRHDDGAAASEYAIVVAVIAVAIFAAVSEYDISPAYQALSDLVKKLVS